jgi:hypothetical protein
LHNHSALRAGPVHYSFVQFFQFFAFIASGFTE